MKTRHVLLAALIVTGCATEPTSIDTLLSKGAKPLTATELREVIVGAEVTGPGTGSGTLYEAAQADGTLGGTGVDAQGSISYFGTWWITDDGEYCFTRKTNSHPWSMNGCERWYRLGSDYFAVRSGVLQKRGVKKI